MSYRKGLATEAIMKDAERLLKRCLGLESQQKLVVMMDESTVETADILVRAAQRLSLNWTALFLPIAVQQVIQNVGELPLAIEQQARDARAIVTCVNGRPDCLRFRTVVLGAHWGARTRIGHMPGACVDVLKLANANINQLTRDCNSIASVLARGREITIVTQTQHGQPHQLSANLGSWDRLPVASDGVIQDGVWGNVPSGEAYIAPVEGTAEGSIVINGSIPGMVISPEEEIVAFFRQGYLVRIEPEGSAANRLLESDQFALGRSHGDNSWANLAEIGFGANPAVGELTGSILLDEKAANTIHIALGKNVFMGGTVNAPIHCDMVIKRSTVTVDGQTIVSEGRLVGDGRSWHPRAVGVSLDDSPMRDAATVHRTGAEVSLEPYALYRLLRSEPGRTLRVQVGDEATSRLAADIYSKLPDGGRPMSIRALLPGLEKEAGTEQEMIRRVLHVLHMYGLVAPSQETSVPSHQDWE